MWRNNEDKNLAVTLVTGEGVHGINPVFNDRHANGPPIVLRPVPANTAPIDSAQIWSFLPVAQLPVEDGTYKIVNSRTRTVLGFEGDAVDGEHIKNVSIHPQPLTSSV